MTGRQQIPVSPPPAFSQPLEPPSRYSRISRERVALHLEDVVFHGVAYRPLVLHPVSLGRDEVQKTRPVVEANKDMPVGRRVR